MVGKTLGHYQITSQLGKGGMGEVYQATDSKLGRDVAIKVLPEEFAKDADRVARFQREAKVLASLNHPSIAAIYGLEESGGTNFLVLELVEGETLADQIKKGPIPIEESLRLALQITEALEAAHEKGVIHRDLKPANVKVTPDGKVKVLDFGLAKAFAGDKEEVNLSNSPTLSDAATKQGVILGTAAYMSPEQARGKTVDKRADIWAFGCVLFEMLTGRAAFFGKDVTDILAAVIRAEPEWNSLPANLHGRLREVLERCLKKEAKDRYHDISDVRADIQRVLTDPSGVLTQPVITLQPRKKLRTILPWLAALFMAAILTGVAVWRWKPAEPREVVRFEYELPEGQQFSDLVAPVLAVSPDGRKLVYSTTNGLYLRSVGESTAKLVAGSEGIAQQPFFSPDGQWIGYWSAAKNELRKIATAGGAPVSLGDVGPLVGASWISDNTIVYGSFGRGILRISAKGGTPESLVRTGTAMIGLPQILPNGKSLLYTLLQNPNKIMIQPLQSGEAKELLAGDTARYLPTGHILYAVGDSLVAAPFDSDGLETSGGGTRVVEGVLRVSYGFSQYAVSDSGTLVYLPRSAGVSAYKYTLVWVDRSGKEEPLKAPPDAYAFPRISPDGRKVALTIAPSGGNVNIWIWDLIRNSMTRLTFGSAIDVLPLWTPDGKRIIFCTNRPDGRSLHWKASDGVGKEEPVGSPFAQIMVPISWSKDGKTLVVTHAAQIGTANFDIGVLSMESDHDYKKLLKEKHSESQPRISPDGRWIAYTSDESGQAQIYVRPFPDVDKERWQASTNGGNSPLWSPDGRELFYFSDGAVNAATVNTKPTFSVGTPRTLFRGKYIGPSINSGASWDISPDGTRFLMLKEDAAGVPHKINIVLNWTEELKQRVPKK